jgi:hypothetical protein
MEQAKQSKQPYNIRLTNYEKLHLDRIAASEGITRAALIHRLIGNHIAINSEQK